MVCLDVMMLLDANSDGLWAALHLLSGITLFAALLLSEFYVRFGDYYSLCQGVAAAILY